MSRHIATFFLSLGLLFALQWSAAAQGTPVQLRLTNTMPQRVDYYLVRPAGTAPKFVGSLPPAMMVDVEARPNDLWVFAVERRKFQEYSVRPEPFQHLTLAPAGLQGQAEVAMAYQPVIGKPVAASPASLPPAALPPTVTLPPVAAPPVAPPPVATAPVAAVTSPDGAVWTYSQYNNPEDSGAVNANLVFGIPETDAVQFVAVCSARSGRGMPSVALAADVSSLPPKAPALVRVTGGGLDASIPSFVLRSSSGEGMEGFVADIDVNNPFWTALGGSGALTYSAQGTDRRSLPLAGSAAPLSKFLSDCRTFAGTAVAVAAAPGPAPTTPAAGNNTCKTMAGVKSENGGQVVVIDFVNRTAETRGLNWVDFDGIPQSYGMLEPGQSIGIETWTTHPWMLTDGPGNCIEMYMPSAATSVFDITVPSPPGGFGPE